MAWFYRNQLSRARVSAYCPCFCCCWRPLSSLYCSLERHTSKQYVPPVCLHLTSADNAGSSPPLPQCHGLPTPPGEHCAVVYYTGANLKKTQTKPHSGLLRDVSNHCRALSFEPYRFMDACFTNNSPPAFTKNYTDVIARAYVMVFGTCVCHWLSCHLYVCFDICIYTEANIQMTVCLPVFVPDGVLC